MYNTKWEISQGDLTQAVIEYVDTVMSEFEYSDAQVTVTDGRWDVVVTVYDAEDTTEAFSRLEKLAQDVFGVEGYTAMSDNSDFKISEA